jgi:localization factor PodJL
MKPGVPWSVKGIEPDAREAAKIAARRSGMTLGEWLNSKILETSDDMSEMRPETYRAPRPTQALERTASRLEDIAEQLSRLSRRDADTAQRVMPVEPDDTMHRVLSRVESNERQTVEAFTAVNDRLSILGRQITQAAKPQASKPEENPGYIALEKAVRNIVEHMEASEKRTKDNFKSLHDRMTAMSVKAAAAPQEAVAKHSPALTQLEARLADLAQRVERSEANPVQTTLPDLLKTELTELANRIDTVRETAEGLASRAQTQAVQTSQKELRAIEGRIVGLIKEAQVSLTGNSVPPAEMQRLRVEVERLNARIDEAHEAQSNGGDIMALRTAVEQLSTRVAQGPDMRPLADMDRRIVEVTEQLEQTRAQTRNLPQVNELERRLAELDVKLNEAATSRSVGPSDEIEQRLSDIASRVARTEQQMGSLETIERAVNQLFDSMETQRNWTQEVADTAANRMAQQIMSQAPQQISLSGAPEIHALNDGLQAVRVAAEQAEGRNQETLEAVHETLEHIVSKLSELETAAIGQRVAAAASAPLSAASFAPPSAFVPSSNPDWDTPVSTHEAGNPFAQAPASQLADVNEPISTGSINPFDAIVQESHPLLEMPSLATPSSTSGSDDFIAAARRAAQAAGQPKSMLNSLSPGAARISQETSKKLLNVDLFKRFKKTKAETTSMGLVGELKPPAGFKAANGNDGKKRKYIVMGIALLAAVSVFAFTMLGQSKKISAPVQPVSIEQQLAPQVIAPDVAPPDASTVQPAQPKPAELESMLEQEGADPLLTGSIEQAGQTNMSALVEGTAPNPKDMPAKATGSLQLREAAAMGNAEAQFIIASRYLNGTDGVNQDFAKAAYWYGKASAAGNAPAQYRLGTMYERGKGVDQDLNAALGWYERAGALGNVKAMHNAAVLASGSAKREPDYPRAFKWFSLGAAHGLKDSQFNLAVLLERGLGTTPNGKEALFWYSMAAKQNDADADKRADRLAKSLSPLELQETKERLQAWTPEVAPDAANTVAVREQSWQASTPDAG